MMQVHIQNDGPVTIPVDTPASLSTQKIKPAKPQKQKNKQQNANNSSNGCTNTTLESVDNVTDELAQL